MADARTLPPNPGGVRILSPRENDDLRRRLSPSELPPPEQCKTCGGTQAFRWYALDARDEVYDYCCSCIDQWVLSHFLAFSGVLDRYQRLGWADVALDDDNPAMTAAAAFVVDANERRTSGRGLALTGARYSGKSLMAILVLKHLMAADGWSGRYLTIHELGDRYRATWRDEDGEGRYAWVNWVTGVDLLIVDDLNNELASGSDVTNNVSARAVTEVLGHRYASGLPTMLVSSVPVATMAKAYPAAGLDRAFDEVAMPPLDAEVVARIQALDKAALKLNRPVVVS